MSIYVKYNDLNGNEFIEPIQVYCEKISRKNNSILYKLEEHLGVKLLSDESLKEIRSIILSTSADINRMAKNVHIKFGDTNERL